MWSYSKGAVIRTPAIFENSGKNPAHRLRANPNLLDDATGHIADESVTSKSDASKTLLKEPLLAKLA